ncbi:MAG: amino acid adenylation domain-containing protein, partial [bacterium]|nr:amino acid adenylation domain-containing protein [bacterium]
INYILADNVANLLLASDDLADPLEFQGQVLLVDNEIEDPAAYEEKYPVDSNGKTLSPGQVNGGREVAYIIYTSGSTGRPRGVMVEHASVVNLAFSQKRHFNIKERERILQFSSISFDASVEQIFITLFSGAALVLMSKDNLMDARQFEIAVARYGITHIHAVPSFLKTLHWENQYQLKRMIAGGDICPVSLAREWHRKCDFYNEYGPTETTVTSIQVRIDILDDSTRKLPIGKPIDNTSVYILDRWERPVPVGVLGELYIGGDGVTRGYLNLVDLTAEKFKPDPFSEGGRFYRTGDLVRWLSDGYIEFLGRIDHQVKIRGYRIEPGEIQNRLSKHSAVNQAIVLAKEDDKKDKYLCAYIVPLDRHIIPVKGDIVPNREVTIPGLREFLAKDLPDYMIPSYFVMVENIPLNPNGKIDYKALPAPEVGSNDRYIAPTTPLQMQLVKLWADVLKIEESVIGIDTNFFELGGHSLKATILIAKIHKELDAKVSFNEIFKSPTIKELAEYIDGIPGGKKSYTSIEPVEKKEYYPLSSTQKRLYILYQMDLESTAYNMPQFIPLEETFPLEKLEETFIKLIDRHESLRTSFHMIDNQPVQKVHDHVELEIECFGRGDPLPLNGDNLDGNHSGSHGGLHLRDFVRPFDLSHAPLLRVGLAGTGEGKHILMVDLHHITSDGVSHQVLVKDFTALHAGEWLPPLRLQYKDYSQWQVDRKESEALKEQETFWLSQFEEEIPILDLPTDYPRPGVQSFEGSNFRSEISSDKAAALRKMAFKEGASLYMVLLALINLLLSKLSGQEEIIVGTPISGRRHADLEKIIGMFVNTLALRNWPNNKKSFVQFLAELKDRALEAFENQEYQFEDLVEQVEVNRDAGRNPIFDVMFTLNSFNPDNKDKIETQKTQPQDGSQSLMRTSKFDLSWIAIESGDHLLFSIDYCTKLFKLVTIQRFISYFEKILSAVVKDPGIKLGEIEIISEEEKKQVLLDFNDTAVKFPGDKTIHQLFEDQVERLSNHVALAGQIASPNSQMTDPYDGFITYKELNKRANRLARYLHHEKDIGTDQPVGVLMERSMELIITLMGVLKSGGAYVPLDPSLPSDRLRVMFNDASIGVVITQQKFTEKLIPLKNQCHEFHSLLPMDDPESIIHEQPTVRPDSTGAGHPAYVMYTSGSSGTPKGVVVEHRTIVNTLIWRKNYYDYQPGDVSLRNPPYFFDSSGVDIFTPLLGGARLVLVPEAKKTDLMVLKRVIPLHNVSHFIAVPVFY